MKNLIKSLSVLVLFLVVNTVTAQKVYNLDAPKTEQQLIGTAIKTVDKAILKGISYPVYQSTKGKMFIVYINKKGVATKKYISNATL